MRLLSPALAVLFCLPAAPQARVDPRAISIHPFTGHRGTAFLATVRGSGLAGATAATVGEAPFSVTVDRVEPEPPGQTTGRNRSPMDLVTIRVQVASDAKPGRYPIRLITRNGISNALPLHVVEFPVTPEP